jgi:hypothetical protein
MCCLMEMLLAVPARRCPEGTICWDGNCGCPDSLPVLCKGDDVPWYLPGMCTDMMEDFFNCGACGNRYGSELLFL